MKKQGKKKFPLWAQILIGLVLGVVYGVLLPDKVVYIKWIGQMFMRGLKMVIVPLILTSIISGVANIGNSKKLGRLLGVTFFYYIMSSLAAILTGLFFVNLIKPGVGANLGFEQKVTNLPVANQSVSDILVNIVPSNIFAAFSENRMLQVIFFAILFGFFVSQIEEKKRDFLINFFDSAFEVMMKITQFVIKFAPFGVFSLVAVTFSKQHDVLQVFMRLGLYMLTVIAALTFHSVITLPLVLKFVDRVNPWKHFRAMSDALLTAFSTASSGATLPVTIDCITRNVGVSEKIASFTLPLGATVNMDGTALYEMVAAMFIAQVYGIHLTFLQQFLAVLTALLASIGAAAVPMAGLIMITIVLSVLGLPLEGIGLIIAVDNFLDMFRTSVNVWSDTVAAVTVARFEGEKFKIDD
jgi:Na+/H+-dicarboxylate symporter